MLNNYIDQLHLINSFRNTIVHDFTNKFYDIAEPSDYTMEILNEVYNFFLNPITIKDYLNSKRTNSPLTVSSEYNLVKILKLISEYNFGSTLIKSTISNNTNQNASDAIECIPVFVRQEFFKKG